MDARAQKTSAWNREDVEISGRRFRGDKTTPDEDTAQFSRCGSSAPTAPWPDWRGPPSKRWHSKTAAGRRWCAAAPGAG